MLSAKVSLVLSEFEFDQLQQALKNVENDLDEIRKRSRTYSNPIDVQQRFEIDTAPVWSKTFIQGIMIILPHIALTLFLLIYVTSGAAILVWLENDAEIEKRYDKFDRIQELYDAVHYRSVNFCQNVTGKNFDDSRSELRPHLENLSAFHEYDDRFTSNNQPWKLNRNLIQKRWTFLIAFTYCLTVISTTGYDHVSPTTDAGRIFAIIFGLVGIPLMFITAANIGKFLSEMVTNGYIEYIRVKRYLYNRIKRIKHVNSTLVVDNEEHEFLKVKLPILAYFVIILSYCSLGGFFFSNYEKGASWTFVSGLFFSFNTITTIGLGNVSVDSVPYAMFIVVYCIVGLAVITMCVDLASAQLKNLFTKLHYFGRTFRGARSTVMNMGDDIKELIHLIAALKSGKSKGQVTLDDLKFFMEYDKSMAVSAYEPKGSKFFKYMDEEDSFWEKFGGPRQRGGQTLHVAALVRNERGEYSANFSEKFEKSAARSPSVISGDLQRKNKSVMV